MNAAITAHLRRAVAAHTSLIVEAVGGDPDEAKAAIVRMESDGLITGRNGWWVLTKKGKA